MPNQPAMTWSICDLCKRPYRVARKELRRGRRFCSKEHANIGRRRGCRNQWGENNPNWKGGRTKHSKAEVVIDLVRVNKNNSLIEDVIVLIDAVVDIQTSKNEPDVTAAKLTWLEHRLKHIRNSLY